MAVGCLPSVPKVPKETYYTKRDLVEWPWVVYHQYCTHSTALTFLALVLCRPSHPHPLLPSLGLPSSSFTQVSTLEIGGWAQTGNEGVRWQGVGRGGKGDGAGVALQALGVATSLFFLAGAFFAVKASHRRVATRLMQGVHTPSRTHGTRHGCD
jgi:hypothetical protein